MSIFRMSKYGFPKPVYHIWHISVLALRVRLCYMLALSRSVLPSHRAARARNRAVLV